MTELEGEQTADTNVPKTRRRTTLIVVSAVVVVALLIVAFLVFRPATTTDAGGATGTAVPTSSTSAGATTPGATGSSTGAPEPGGRPTQTPIAFDDDAEPLPGVTVAITGLEAVDGEATGVGEISGPAVRVSVEFVNGSDAEVDLRTVQVTADSGPDRTASSELSGPGVVAFPARLAAGDRATAVYVFAVPADQRESFRVFVDSVVTAPVVLFEGAAPSA
ncbi:hypothetical protein ACQ3HE_07080 [Plantibacter auratus]|uniref:hypothetical protein n=1 Tax=Plantibacter auratus TaxID=272914 RepID=UPI003D34F1E2